MVSLRPATAVDAAALVACVTAAYRRYADQGIDLPPVSDGIDQDIAENIVWLAVADGQVVGGAIVSIADHVAKLKNVAVDPACAGMGVGGRLIDAAVTSAQQAWHAAIELVTHKDMPRNIALYERLGWQVTGQDGTRVFMRRQIT